MATYGNLDKPQKYMWGQKKKKTAQIAEGYIVLDTICMMFKSIHYKCAQEYNIH